MALLLVVFAFSLLFCPSFCQSKFCAKNCQINEVYSANVSQCQNTCFYQDFNTTANCETAPGCVCQAGYIRHQDTYRCIPISSCPIRRGAKHCPENEYFSNCDAECQQSCSRRNENVRCKCVSGCSCRTGFVRSDITYQCIPVQSCQTCPTGYAFSQLLKKCVLDCTSCKANEVYKTCGTLCEATCSNPTNEGIYCNQVCKTGCFCDKGYVRDINGACVAVKNCPKCPENESFSCGNPLCETNCLTIGQKCTKYPIRCTNQCYCIKGYVRALNGSQCVSESQCPVINN